MIDTDWAFDRYEAVRHRLPSAHFPRSSERAGHLADLADRIDVFVLDAFGVLNVGDTAIPGAADRIAELRQLDKHVLVLTNGATYDETISRAKYTRFGFDFSLPEIISSRSVLQSAMQAGPQPGPWGLIAASDSNFHLAGTTFLQIADDPDAYELAAGFILLSSASWTVARQDLLTASLANHPRPVLVGNPDIIAPRETSFSLEPGNYAHDLADKTGVEPAFFGKPFANAFDAVRARLAETGNPTDPTRIAMVGDTLHTDILGGAAAGLKTVLVSDHGLFAGRDVASYIERSGITPDFIVPTT